MKGYITEKYSDMKNAYTTARITEEGKKRGFDISIIGTADTLITREGLIWRGKRLEEADFVLNRYKYGMIKDEISRLGKVSLNNIEKLKRYINKANQMRDIDKNVIDMPDYIIGRLTAEFGAIAEKLGLPFIAKGLESSQGKEVFLIENTEDYERLLKRFKEENRELLFEKYIKTSFGRDVRFIMIGGEIKACMQRKAKSGFRANFSLGAEVRSYNVDERIKEIGASIYKTTGLDIVGVDLLFGEDDYAFCEINVTPGIEGIEKASGKNIAGEIIRLFEERL